MDDLISRQAAIDAVEKKIRYTDHDEPVVDWNDFVAALCFLPTAEPEIIRCKECKHNYVDGDNVRFNVCELMHNKVQSDDWYCADAERRTDG